MIRSVVDPVLGTLMHQRSRFLGGRAVRFNVVSLCGRPAGKERTRHTGVGTPVTIEARTLQARAGFCRPWAEAEKETEDRCLSKPASSAQLQGGYLCVVAG